MVCFKESKVRETWTSPALIQCAWLFTSRFLNLLTACSRPLSSSLDTTPFSTAFNSVEIPWILLSVSRSSEVDLFITSSPSVLVIFAIRLSIISLLNSVIVVCHPPHIPILVKSPRFLTFVFYIRIAILTMLVSQKKQSNLYSTCSYKHELWGEII